jgi:hypothetical protein
MFLDPEVDGKIRFKSVKHRNDLVAANYLVGRRKFYFVNTNQSNTVPLTCSVFLRFDTRNILQINKWPS